MEKRSIRYSPDPICQKYFGKVTSPRLLGRQIVSPMSVRHENYGPEHAWFRGQTSASSSQRHLPCRVFLVFSQNRQFSHLFISQPSTLGAGSKTPGEAPAPRRFWVYLATVGAGFAPWYSGQPPVIPEPRGRLWSDRWGPWREIAQLKGKTYCCTMGVQQKKDKDAPTLIRLSLVLRTTN